LTRLFVSVLLSIAVHISCSRRGVAARDAPPRITSRKAYDGPRVDFEGTDGRMPREPVTEAVVDIPARPLLRSAKFSYPVTCPDSVTGR
jgi:hypothetical protein